MTAPSNAAEIAARLRDRIADLAEYLIGSPPTFRSRTALRFYPRGGLAIEVAGDRRGLWCDHAGGQGGDALDLVRHLRRCSMAEAIAWARDWLGDAPVDLPERQPPPRPEPVPVDTTSIALRLWKDATAAPGTPAEGYLRSRGLTLPDSGVIRFHPACPRGRDERLPAMVSLMTHPETAEPVGLHRTFLAADGAGKVDQGQQKMMIGRAGVIRLVEDAEVTIGLGIAEGIETALAVMQRAAWRPVWACGSAGAISKFPILPGIEALTIFADHDLANSKTGRRAGMDAALECALRWQAGRRDAVIATPPEGGDWLDALMPREAAA